MDTTQLLLTIVLTVSTIFCVIIGIQLIFVLRDLRKTLKSINTIISGLEEMGLGLEHGLSEITGFFAGIKSLFRLLELTSSEKNEKNKSASN
jgi:hypothetical protein